MEPTALRTELSQTKRPEDEVERCEDDRQSREVRHVVLLSEMTVDDEL
jgi:hypothetical protein